jgi:hypothetical protein
MDLVLLAEQVAQVKSRLVALTTAQTVVSAEMAPILLKVVATS